MMAERARIVEAMLELKERRDAGELVHVILPEIAEDHAVAVDALTRLAEKSWGAPLETDRERHAEYFRLVEGAVTVVARANDWADFLFRQKVGVPDYGWSKITWEDHLRAGLRNWK